ncbi:MAG: chromate transporter [Eubacteriales bacterium]|nr:chromate transporter [Eubacteriales bacterium]
MMLVRLFLEFFKTGLFAVGGGLATIPFLYEMADKYKWFDRELIADMIAVSEATPGPIGVNMATYTGFSIGYGEYGVLGGVLYGIITTLGLVTPSIIVVLIIAKALDVYKSNPLVQSAFYSLRPAVSGLICAVAISLATETFNFSGDIKISIITSVMFILSVLGVFKLKKIHPILFILVGAVLGVVLGL